MSGGTEDRRGARRLDGVDYVLRDAQLDYELIRSFFDGELHGRTALGLGRDESPYVTEELFIFGIGRDDAASLGAPALGALRDPAPLRRSFNKLAVVQGTLERPLLNDPYLDHVSECRPAAGFG